MLTIHKTFMNASVTRPPQAL